MILLTLVHTVIYFDHLKYNKSDLHILCMENVITEDMIRFSCYIQV